MNTERWLILREQRRAGDIFSVTRSSDDGGISRAVDIFIEVKDLDRKEQHELHTNPTVAGCAPAFPMRLIAPVLEDAPSEFGCTWGVARVRASSSRFTGAGVTIAVLDTGIEKHHPAFHGMADRIEEADFTGEGNGDHNGHGTHCAGTIFGRDHDGLRYSVAPGISRALIGKVLNADGNGSSESVCRGMVWALERGANVVSMSIGFDFPGYAAQLQDSGMPPELATSKALEGYRMNIDLFGTLSAFIHKAGEDSMQGTIIVAAAGNESRRDKDPNFVITAPPPAASDHIIAVGAISRDGKIARFSNANPDLVAPGVHIFSAHLNGKFARLNGTSMATPHVAGVAALWAEKLRTGARFAPAKTLTARVLGTAQEIDGVPLTDQGTGVVQSP